MTGTAEIVGVPCPEHAVSAAHRHECSAPGWYAVVIPAYNEAATIREVVQGALRHAKQVWVVDDGSTDGTAQALDGLPINLIRNGSNKGKAASLWSACHAAMEAGAQACVSLDGDGQHSPGDIPRLVAAAEQHPDCLIIGARQRHWRRGPFWRLAANQLADFWVSWAAGYPIQDTQSGFRVYPTRLLQEASVKHDKTHSFVFESEVLIEGARLGFQSIPVPIESASRKASRPSHFRPVLDILRITRMVAWKLLSRGMYPVGLYRSLVETSRAADVDDQSSDPASTPAEPKSYSSPS